MLQYLSGAPFSSGVGSVPLKAVVSDPVAVAQCSLLRNSLERSEHGLSPGFRWCSSLRVPVATVQCRTMKSRVFHLGATNALKTGDIVYK